MSNQPAGLDPQQYKANTREQWNQSGGGYNAWGNTIDQIISESCTRMLEQAAVSQGQSVLELAAGSGVLTQRLASMVGDQGKVMATDLSPGILEYTKENIKAKGYHNVETRTMDAEEMDVPEASYDAVLSSLGLMFVPDSLKSLQGQHKAVKEGGKVGALVIGPPDKNPFFSIPAKVIMERAKIPPPQPGAPGPFALGAPGLLQGKFEEAGFRDVTSEVFGGHLELSSIAEHLRFLGEAFGALHMMMKAMDESEKKATWEAVTEALHPFEGPDGFKCPYELVMCVGTR